MPTELFYSTGQAAREWGVSVATVRALCAAGAIEHETTPGGQYRIASSVVEKLKRDGLPTVPRPLPGDNPRPARSGHGHPGLLGEPSEDVIESAEGVVCLENEVKSLDLLQQKEEKLDWFREREERQALRLAERDKAEQTRRAQIEAERRRSAWTNEWIQYALNSIPYDAPREIELDVHQAVEEALAGMQPSQPDRITERIVDAAVERALAPWRRRKEIEAAIQEASDSLPSRATSEWELRARQAASEAIARLRADATGQEIRSAACHAVQPIIKQFEHERAYKEVLYWAPLRLCGGTADDREQATIAAKAALEALPVGASRREMERARDIALAPIQAAIDKRQEQEARMEEAARRQSDAEFRVMLRLNHVGDYLSQEVEFDGPLDGFFERQQTADKLKERIRPILVKELLKNPDLTDRAIEKRIESLVDEDLDDVLQELDED